MHFYQNIQQHIQVCPWVSLLSRTLKITLLIFQRIWYSLQTPKTVHCVWDFQLSHRTIISAISWPLFPKILLAKDSLQKISAIPECYQCISAIPCYSAFHSWHYLSFSLSAVTQPGWPGISIADRSALAPQHTCSRSTGKQHLGCLSRPNQLHQVHPILHHLESGAFTEPQNYETVWIGRDL